MIVYKHKEQQRPDENQAKEKEFERCTRQTLTEKKLK
jgi:hypothetical protein